MPRTYAIPDAIETRAQYRDLRARMAALDRHLKAISDLRRMADEHMAMDAIQETDLRDLAPLEDAESDIAFTRAGLNDVLGAWEERTAYPRRKPPRAPVVATGRHWLPPRR